jgi:TonB-dependent starch-binding outer membrane protein SusC
MAPKRLLKRVGAFMLLLMVLVQAGFAQSRTVTGKVTDSKDGSPVPNASVTIKGTDRGTTTDATGNFRLTVDNNNAVLVISSVGFTRLEVPVGAQTELNIGLNATSANLNEVVVVGYGTQRKRDLTGAVATVSSKDFVKGALQSPEQLITGKVAGVQITPGGGSPGSGSVIRIRGEASVNGSNDPLIVIDGVPIAKELGIAGSSNPLNLINPNDIETFTILKDPSAAAIYGSRASAGVILITTKKGKKGKLRYNFGAQGFLQTVSKQVDILSADEFRSVVAANGTPSQIALLGKSSTNWQDEIYRTALGQDYNLSVTGAAFNGKWPFRISGGYLNQDGTLFDDNLQRLTGSLNLNPSFLNNKLKVDFNLKLSNSKNQFADQGAIGNAVSFDPTQAIRSGSNRYGGYWEWLDPDGLPKQLSNRNPVALNDPDLYYSKSDVFRTISNLQFDYQLPFLKGLRANVNLGIDFSQGRGLSTRDSAAAANYRGKGNYTPYYSENLNLLYDVYLNYVKDIKSINSRIDVMAGHGRQGFTFYSYNHPGRRFAGDTIPNSQSEFINNGNPGYLMISYYGRLVYTLANKYVLTSNIRTDGSSKYYPGGRWGVFPSVAFAWRLSEEGFLKNSKVVSDLKIRVGYGVTGQQEGIGFYEYIPRYSRGNNQALYQFGSNFYNITRPEGYFDRLRWETTSNTNVAVDFGFFDNRLSGTVEGFIRNTKDLLFTVNVPAGANFNNRILQNIGNIEGKGFEVTLNVVPVRNKNVEWSIAANVSSIVPKVTKLEDNPTPDFKGYNVGGIDGGTGNTIQLIRVGEVPNSFYVYKQVYDQNNKPIEGLYEDLNRDGIINENDLYVYENPYSNLFIGFSSNISVKRFNAGFVLRSNIGNYNYNNFASNRGVLRGMLDPLGFLANGSADYLNTGFANNQYFSDYYIQNASFLRMDNINIGYDAGEVAKNVRLRLSANVQNAFIITKYKGLDPEIFQGRDNNIYPRPRIFALGLNLDF